MASQQEEPEDHDEEKEEDDFSFPTTTSSPPRFIGSPQLWRSSSNSLYLLETQEEPSGDDEKKKKKINLFSSYIKSKDGGGNDENMDVIWEDLNYEEEICGFIQTEFDQKMPPELGRRRRRNMVKVGGGKRLSMVVLVNVLKKLFLLHNASRNKLDLIKK